VLQNGKNVYPEEVEYRLLKSPFIAEAVVSGASSGAERGMASREGDTRGAKTGVASSVVSGAAAYGFSGVVVQAEIYPDAEAIRRAFGDTAEGDVRKIIDREVDKANESMPPHMGVRRVVLRPVPFDKTTTKKIKRAPRP
jgi:long-chain acyl-CoA synthetase